MSESGSQGAALGRAVYKVSVYTVYIEYNLTFRFRLESGVGAGIYYKLAIVSIYLGIAAFSIYSVYALAPEGAKRRVLESDSDNSFSLESRLAPSSSDELNMSSWQSERVILYGHFQPKSV